MFLPSPSLCSVLSVSRAELLKRAIFNSERLYSFAERPLLLTLMASLHAWRGGSLPEKREELYNDTIDLLLDWWESGKVIRDADGQRFIPQESLTALLNVGKEHVQRILNTLAFNSHASQVNLEDTADIPEEKLVSELMNLSQNKDLRPVRLIEHLSDRAGLLVPRGVKIYTFPHRTFQEYLTACHLTDQDDYPDNIAELARKEPNRWREVILLAGAKAARVAAASIWTLAEALCYRDCPANGSLTPGAASVPLAFADETSAVPGANEPFVGQEDAWGALLAGQALVETANLQQISPRNQSKRDRIRRWLRAILTEQVPQDTPFPATERALAGNLLAQLGDQRPGVGLREDGLPDIAWCEVPAGTFLMGTDPEKDKEAWKDEYPQHEVHVSAYMISRYPVTNAQYQTFVEDAGYAKKEYWTDEGWEWKNKSAPDGPEKAGGEFDLANHPVVAISWYEASAFCKWLTISLQEKGELSGREEVRLPSEAEWEKAARGNDGRIYPWGGDLDSELVNYDDTGIGATSAVGCFPRGASPYGCEEMVGNVLEWCLDTWHGNYEEAPTDGSAWLRGGSNRVHRGGSWGLSARDVRCAVRGGSWPGRRGAVFGFRLARIYP